MRYAMKAKKGFTLIEVLLACLVTVLLASFAIYQFKSSPNKINIQEALFSFSDAKNRIAQNYAKSGRCESVNLDENKIVTKMGSLIIQDTSKTAVKGTLSCDVKFTFSSDVNSDLANKVLILTLKVNGYIYNSDSTLPKNMLPNVVGLKI